MLNWDLNNEESDLISKIAERAGKSYPDYSFVYWGMDITAAHCNGCRLKLSELVNNPALIEAGGCNCPVVRTV